VIGGASDFFRSLEGLPPSGAFGPGQCITLDDTGAAPTYLPLNLNNVQKENNVSWRSGLNYQPDPNTLLYALVSRAIKRAFGWSTT